MKEEPITVTKQHTNISKQIDISELANELTYRKYLFDKDSFRNFFADLRILDYIILYTIRENEKASAIYSGRTYLHELADKVKLSIRQTSKVVRELRDKGVVKWSHDGDGSEGTYVTITPEGLLMLQRQEESLKSLVTNVVQKFGQENLVSMLRLMKEFGTVVSGELEQKQEIVIDE